MAIKLNSLCEERGYYKEEHNVSMAGIWAYMQGPEAADLIVNKYID